jgi:hypothetical protein
MAIGSFSSIYITLYLVPGTVYFEAGTGAQCEQSVYRQLPNVRFDIYKTMSAYFQKASNRYVQLSVGSDYLFAKFDMKMGVNGTKHAFVESGIVPAGNEWYRCSMEFSSPIGSYMVFNIVEYANATKAQIKSLRTSLFIADPQMEIGRL